MTHEAQPVVVFITLGSNIEPETNLRRAVRMITQNRHLTLHAISRVYESPAIDAAGQIAPDQDHFLNAAVMVESDGHFPPMALKYNMLRFIELCLGRTRGPDKYAPRTIDLDIALYGDQVIDTPHITIPDPDILTRVHIALPLADLAPNLPHPVTGRSLAAIAAPLAANTPITVRADLDLTS